MYKIIFHDLVYSDDFKNIPKSDQKRIFKVINKKLKYEPEIFGKPLQAKLKGFYRLRIDQYRVIYRINKKRIEVFIIKIGLRKDLIAYIKAAQRLKLL